MNGIDTEKYYEKKLDETEAKNDPNSQLQYPVDDNIESIDISNLVTNPTDENISSENTVPEDEVNESNEVSNVSE